MSTGAPRQLTYGQWWDTTEELVTLSLDAVRRVCLAGLEEGGASPEDAEFILQSPLDKALQDDHTRGLGRLPGMVRAAKAGQIDLNPKIEVLRDHGATALVESSRNASHPLVCRFSMDLAIEKARRYGVGWVGGKTMGGVLTPFVRREVDAGMVGMILTQSFPSVAPLGGKTPLLGNAPVAFGIPAKDHDPVILDLSITESSASGMFLTAKQGQQAPEGALLDEHGDPTLDAREFVTEESLASQDMVARGSLRPLGGGHKGYALVFVVGLLSYLLTDTSTPWDLRRGLDSPGQVGTIFVAVDPGAFIPAGEVVGRVDGFIDRVKDAPKKDGISEILYPGERSQQYQREGRKSGSISLPASHYHGLAGLAAELGMEGAL